MATKTGKGKYKKAHAALCEFIKLNWPKGEKQPDKVSVYDYEMHGYRIAEVSATWRRLGSPLGLRGAAWMRSEMPRVILAAEEFVITFGKRPLKHEDGYVFDMHQEAKDNLKDALHNE